MHLRVVARMLCTLVYGFQKEGPYFDLVFDEDSEAFIMLYMFPYAESLS